MKKLWFAALMLGLCWLAVPTQQVQAHPIMQSQSTPETELTEVIRHAAIEFGLSEEEAWNAYNHGDLAIQETEGNTYIAQYGGDVREIIIDAL